MFVMLLLLLLLLLLLKSPGVHHFEAVHISTDVEKHSRRKGPRSQSVPAAKSSDNKDLYSWWLWPTIHCKNWPRRSHEDTQEVELIYCSDGRLHHDYNYYYYCCCYLYFTVQCIMAICPGVPGQGQPALGLLPPLVEWHFGRLSFLLLSLVLIA